MLQAFARLLLIGFEQAYAHFFEEPSGSFHLTTYLLIVVSKFLVLGVVLKSWNKLPSKSCNCPARSPSAVYIYILFGVHR